MQVFVQKCKQNSPQFFKKANKQLTFSRNVKKQLHFSKNVKNTDAFCQKSKQKQLLFSSKMLTKSYFLSNPSHQNHVKPNISRKANIFGANKNRVKLNIA